MEAGVEISTPSRHGRRVATPAPAAAGFAFWLAIVFVIVISIGMFFKRKESTEPPLRSQIIAERARRRAQIWAMMEEYHHGLGRGVPSDGVSTEDGLQQRQSAYQALVRAVDRLPVRAHPASDDAAAEKGCCAVCLEDFSAGEMLRELPCGHQFHKARSLQRGALERPVQRSFSCPASLSGVYRRVAALGLHE